MTAAFYGQVAVITGGAGGIGIALARQLGAGGASIVLADVDQHALDNAVGGLEKIGIEAQGVICNVADLASTENLASQAFEWRGRVDLLINNAGVSQNKHGKLFDVPMAEVERVFAVNFYGVWHCCRAFLPRMAEQDHPCAIYNVGSENSLFCAVKGSAAYIASKHAVLGMTESLREDVPPHVHVGTIIPGWVSTGLNPEEFLHLGMSADTFASIIVPQIAARERFVVSHSYNAVRMHKRTDALDDAFARNAPRHEGDDEHDVRHVIARMRAAARKQE